MAKRKSSSTSSTSSASATQPDQLLDELRQMIEAARARIAETANSVLTMLHWHVGTRIRREVLKEARAEYGLEILPTLSAELAPRFGRGFSAKSLARMVQFAEVFPEEPIVATLSRQLSWSHFVELMPLVQPSQRKVMKLSQFKSGRDARGPREYPKGQAAHTLRPGLQSQFHGGPRRSHSNQVAAFGIRIPVQSRFAAVDERRVARRAGESNAFGAAPL
ncbi:Protein of unknown function [Singulisphaera sp. GP187]|uniref:DUF1016 N-terminal domain-containing protein n=1 Tax=Singulisphaera sp. GP187 TaxID=1882752 RepID=UPI000927B240|nr:Protein of unknown function [Singulisphaera sp. GP187]